MKKIAFVLLPLLTVSFLVNCGNTPTVKEHYTITWKRDDGHVLKEDICDKDTLPTYNGADPSYEDARGTHTFDNKWTPDVVPAVKDTTYTAVYTTVLKKYLITFKNDDGSTLTSDTKEYEYGTTPTPATPTSTKTPTAKYQYDFAGWKDEDGNIGLKSVTGVTTYTATYVQAPKKYNVSLSSSTGGTITGGGEYPCDSDVTITATPSTGYTFDGWYEGDSSISSEPTYTFKMPENDVSYKAVFKANIHTVTLTSAPTTGGTVSGAGEYSYGTNVIITATPSTGYTFDGWYEGDSPISIKPSFTFPMPDNDINYKAVFKANIHTVTLTNSPTTGGTVNGSGQYAYGANVTITATPNAGYAFDGWYEGDTLKYSSSTYKFPMPDKDITYTAKWKELGQTIIVLNSSNSQQTLRFEIGRNDNFDLINWGDGSTPNKELTHTYSATSQKKKYYVKIINPDLTEFILAGGCNKENIVNIYIPDGTLKIRDTYFNRCLSLISITIPNSVNSIDNLAFNYCDALETVDLSSVNHVIKPGFEMFKNCTKLKEIKVKGNLVDQYKDTWMEYAGIIVPA